MRSVRPLGIAGALVAATVCNACNTSDLVSCTTNIVPSIIVTIRDSSSDAAIAAVASGLIQDGAYTDSLRPFGSVGGTLISRFAGQDRPGLYAVSVSGPNYQTWQAVNVRVEKGVCHVHSAELTAKLQHS